MTQLSWSLDPSAAQAVLRANDPRRSLAVAFSTFPGWDDDWPWYLRNVLGRAWRLRRWRPVLSLPVIDEGGLLLKRVREYRKQRSSLLRSPPPLSRGIDEYIRNANELASLAKRSGVRVLFMTQPMLWGAGLSEAEQDLLWGGGPPMQRGRPGQEYYSVEVMALAMRQYNQALLDLCGDIGAECIDAASRMSRIAEFFYDDAHYTDAGSERMARIISEHLLRSPPLGPGVSPAARGAQRAGGP
jgi:hypothetical protein